MGVQYHHWRSDWRGYRGMAAHRGRMVHGVDGVPACDIQQRKQPHCAGSSTANITLSIIGLLVNTKSILKCFTVYGIILTIK